MTNLYGLPAKYAGIELVNVADTVKFRTSDEAENYANEITKKVRRDFQNAEAVGLVLETEAQRWFKVINGVAVEKSWNFEKIEREVDKCVYFLNEGAVEKRDKKDSYERIILKSVEQLKAEKELAEDLARTELARKAAEIIYAHRCPKIIYTIAQYKELKEKRKTAEEASKQNVGLKIRTDNDNNIMRNSNKRPFDAQSDSNVNNRSQNTPKKKKACRRLFC